MSIVVVSIFIHENKKQTTSKRPVRESKQDIKLFDCNAIGLAEKS